MLRYDPIQFDAVGEYEIDELRIEHIRMTGDQVTLIQWAPGILERESGRVIYYCIPDRTTVILVPRINDSVPPGSIIYSEELSSYHDLDRNFYHFAVNLSQGEYVRIKNTEDLFVEGSKTTPEDPLFYSNSISMN